LHLAYRDAVGEIEGAVEVNRSVPGMAVGKDPASEPWLLAAFDTSGVLALQAACTSCEVVGGVLVATPGGSSLEHQASGSGTH
jgi:hypothetical protein